MADNVFVFDHPLIQHKVSLLRDKNTSTKEFRELVSEIAMLMAYEVTRDLPMKEVEIETPVATAKVKMLAGKDIAEREVILLDPMLATGGSASAAITFLKKRGIENIKFMCLIAAPEGINRVVTDHPDVRIFCAARDEKLNDHSYIVPGLGDAGDRLFGTN